MLNLVRAIGNPYRKPISIYVLVTLILTAFLASGCASTAERLSRVGLEPPFNEVGVHEDKTAPIKWPEDRSKKVHKVATNSLWDQDSRSFFRDQRARNVGDILTVDVAIADKAELDNKTEQTRDTNESLGAPNIFGLENKIVGALPGDADPSSLLSVTGASDTEGEGVIEREEIIETKMAAVVTQILPGGNLRIYGSQEVRVNFEVRQLTVEGVVRPEDIEPDNSIDYSRIAEARISYGGRGTISDVQQPRFGNQVIDILSPW